MKKILLVGIALMAMLPPSAFARGRGLVIVGPVFAPYGWYGWYDPYWGPYPYGLGPGFAGEVKLETNVKDAEVFINGNYAGKLKQLRTMMMSSGDYDISIRASGREPFEQKVHVVAAKTLTLHPELGVQANPASTTPSHP